MRTQPTRGERLHPPLADVSANRPNASADQLNMRSSPPLYQQIADELMEEIASGRYPVGVNLPTEHQLSASYNVSRATAVAALDRLAELGLVYRRPRVGTQVISRFPMRSSIEEGSVFHDWARFGTEYVLEVTERRRTPLTVLAGDDACADGRLWLCFSGIRTGPRSPDPLCTVDVYVNPDYALIEKEVTARPPRIFSLIEARYGLLIRVVDQELKAVRLEGDLAHRIGVPEGVPGIQILRWYRGPRGKLVEFTVDHHPGDRFRYRTRMHRGPRE